jgi:hypothetical protein
VYHATSFLTTPFVGTSPLAPATFKNWQLNLLRAYRMRAIGPSGHPDCSKGNHPWATAI